jgi:hypothetical protein
MHKFLLIITSKLIILAILNSFQVRNYNWAAGSCSILAELGTFSMEFQYLTDITGKKEYVEKVRTLFTFLLWILSFFNFYFNLKIDKIYQTLSKARNQNGLYYNYMNQNNGNWCGGESNSN